MLLLLFAPDAGGFESSSTSFGLPANTVLTSSWSSSCGAADLPLPLLLLLLLLLLQVLLVVLDVVGGGRRRRKKAPIAML
jgi:hypothetical protein